MPIESGTMSKRQTRWLAPRESFEDSDQLPKLVLVQAGPFQMGAGEDERGRRKDELPKHEVVIKRPFAAGVYPVTVAEWEAARSKGFDGAPQIARDQGLPATHISWTAAKAYTAWLRKFTGFHYRLLSEAEWEYACRAGSERPVPVGAAQYDMSYSIARGKVASEQPVLKSAGGAAAQ